MKSPELSSQQSQLVTERNQGPTVEDVDLIVRKSLDYLNLDYQLKIIEGRTRSMCGTFTACLKELLKETLPVKTARSDHEDGNAHTFLVIPGTSPDKDIIIDPTIGQFLKGQNHVFVGTRSDLKELVLNPETEIINTRSKNNPQEAFERTWGMKSNLIDY